MFPTSVQEHEYSPLVLFFFFLLIKVESEGKTLFLALGLELLQNDGRI